MTARGLAQGATGGMRRARVQNARVAGSEGDRFRGPSTAQTEADRINILVSIQSRAVTWLSRHSHVWSTFGSLSSARRTRAAQDPSPSCICNNPSRTPESMYAVMML